MTIVMKYKRLAATERARSFVMLECARRERLSASASKGPRRVELLRYARCAVASSTIDDVMSRIGGLKLP